MTEARVRQPCPLCGGSSELAFVTTDRNRRISDVMFRYRRCDDCEAVWLENVPADLSTYYPSDYYARPDAEGLREMARSEAYRMDFLAPYAGGGRLLEIGAGWGLFTVQAVDAGYDVSVIEMDVEMCAHLASNLGVSTTCSDRPEVAVREQPPSDVIAMWHVLEHLPDPWGAVEASIENLKPGGILIIAVPNPGSLGFRVLGGRWPHVDAPRHLCLIPAGALVGHAQSRGMDVVRISASDEGARNQNAFAWWRAVANAGGGALPARPAQLAGFAIAAALGPIERRGLRGATYTLVLRKRAPA